MYVCMYIYISISASRVLIAHYVWASAAFWSVALLACRARWLGTWVRGCLVHSRLVQGSGHAPTMEPMAEVAPSRGEQNPSSPAEAALL